MEFKTVENLTTGSKRYFLDNVRVSRERFWDVETEYRMFGRLDTFFGYTKNGKDYNFHYGTFGKI